MKIKYYLTDRQLSNIDARCRELISYCPTDIYFIEKYTDIRIREYQDMLYSYGELLDILCIGDKHKLHKELFKWVKKNHGLHGWEMLGYKTYTTLFNWATRNGF